MAGTYRAILLDVDGTSIDDLGSVHPETRSAVRQAVGEGAIVMIATGRSALGTLPVLDDLELVYPALVFNGAGIYCPTERRFLEERVLSNRAVERALGFAFDGGYLPVVMRDGEKFAPPPRNLDEERAIERLEGLEILPADELPREYLTRITLLANGGLRSGELARRVEVGLDCPAYLTDFPLNALAEHRQSPIQVVDVQPPCRGKAEALRFLEEREGISWKSVVAVGDASNDVPMLRAAGLGVAMGNAMEDAKSAANRVIGDNNSPALADLIEELFLS